MDRPAEHQSGSDTSAYGKVQHMGAPLRRPKDGLAERRRVGVVVHNRGQAGALRDQVSQRRPIPPLEVVAGHRPPGRIVDGPAEADANSGKVRPVCRAAGDGILAEPEQGLQDLRGAE